jgi:hypothetical protein
MSSERIRQVRHIIQADEVSFYTEFTPQQLMSIESREMASIFDELMSAIGLQRFRFSVRQKKGSFIFFFRVKLCFHHFLSKIVLGTFRGLRRMP